jgi:hypothetical protein
MALGIDTVVLAVFAGVLFAIIWSLRILVLLERRIKRMDDNLLRIVMRIENEELKIEREEEKIEKELELDLKRRKSKSRK